MQEMIWNRTRAPRIPINTPGRATIELVLLPSQQVQVTVTRWCDRRVMIETVMQMVDAIRHSPQVIVNPFEPEKLRKRRRGGPAPMPEQDKLRIVQAWLRLQGHMTEDVYAREQGISSATLRRWKRQLELEGKL